MASKADRRATSALGGVSLGGAAYLALATATAVPVCAAIGALAGQLAPERGRALQLGGAAVTVLFLARVLADIAGLTWLRWLTPLGWAELPRPFAGSQPAVLLLPAVATAALFALTWRIATVRDVGAGLLRGRDSSEPHVRLLGSPFALALRTRRGALLAWIGTLAAFSYILGTIAKSVAPADISKSLQREIAKLGTGSITTPTGYLAFLFSFFALFVCVFVCLQIAAARQEEASQRLETLLAGPVGRRRWLAGRPAGRIVLAIASAAVIAVACGLGGWAGARTAGVHLQFWRAVEAGADMLPIAVLFLGIAVLAYGLAPRWLLDITPFAHVGLVPGEPFRTVGALVMVVIGAAPAGAALELFRRRNLVGD